LRETKPTHKIDARLPKTPGLFGPSLVALQGNREGDISDGNMLSDVDSCSTCHPDAAAQWGTSPHSFASFGNPIYRVNVELARTELGKEASQHCGGCHDMPLMVDGLMAENHVPGDDLRAHSGVTCRLCHGIKSVSKDGNGSYVWSRAPLDAPTLGDAASIEKHRAQVSVKSLGTELCVGCHRGFLSPDMGQGMPVHLSGLDEPGSWRNSAWTGNGMGRVDKVDKKTCIDCHMEREPASKDEYAASHDGKIASHRFLGGHTWMAAMRGDDEHLQRMQAKLQGVASIDVQPSPTGVGFDVVIRNLLVGHRFPGGVMDIQDTWIEVEVRNAKGTLVATSGVDHDKNAHDEDTHVLRTLVVDETGHVLEKHEMPRFRTQIAPQSLAAREAQAIRYVLPEAAQTSGPHTVTARLRHRSRTLQMQEEVCRAARTAEGKEFLSGAKGAREVTLDPCRAQPITLIAETTAVIGNEPNTSSWEKQYEHGMALTSVISERLEEARTVLEHALAAAPEGKPKAMVIVQLAVVASKQGRADDALALIAQARKLLPEPGPPVLDAVEADALSRVWRWEEAVMPAKRAAEKAKANSQAWVVAARCYGSVSDNEAALAAAIAGLELSPRDPDLLRSQATALAALNRPEAADALSAYDRFRSPDQSAELRISCAVDSPRCAREREQGHSHTLHLVR
jgi:tetratricopeptide (TPR) repeat protein